MPPTPFQRQQIASFSTLTHTSEKVATRFLKNCGWQLDAAMELFFQQSHGIPARSHGALVSMFDSIRDANSDEKDCCGTSGILKYFDQLGVSPDNISALVVLEIVQASGMEQITRSGFVDGWMASGASDTLQKQRQKIAEQMKCLIKDTSYFRSVYRWTFGFAKESNQKALQLETAIVYWGVLFSPPGPSLRISAINWLDEYVSFLRETWKKSVNKDMWNQTLEFFLKAIVDESLSFWSEDGAWPSVIDDFVAHIKQKYGGSPENMEID